jgi:hypothetical protein
MKKTLLIPALLLSLSVYGQKQKESYPMSDLLKFESSKERLYSILNTILNREMAKEKIDSYHSAIDRYTKYYELSQKYEQDNNLNEQGYEK